MQERSVSEDQGREQPVDDVDREVVVHVVDDVDPLELAVVVVGVHRVRHGDSERGVEHLQVLARGLLALVGQEDDREQVEHHGSDAQPDEEPVLLVGQVVRDSALSEMHNETAEQAQLQVPHVVVDGLERRRQEEPEGHDEDERFLVFHSL